MMSSPQLGKALTNIKSYDSSFKVEIRLHEPLWKDHFSGEEISLEILSLLSQLEPLCKGEYTKSSGGIVIEHRKDYLSKFVPLANISVGKMREYLGLLPGRLNLKDYLKQTGLAILFPRVSSFIFDSSRPVFNQKSIMDGYFTHLAVLNQLASLSNQLNCDINNSDNHKYVAHQTALLYQAVNQAGSSMGHVKKHIEDNFRDLKESLSASEKADTPKLPRVQKEWMNSITGEIFFNLTSLQATQSLQPIVHFLKQQIKT